MINRAFLTVLLASLVFPAFADHVLLTDGTALFNVSLVDNISTSARPLRVIYRNNSFLYDYHRESPTWLGNQISGQFHIADYITTTTQLKDKKQMRAFFEQHHWQQYHEPVTQPLTMPTPQPTPILTPVPRETPLPVNVASTSLPLEERLIAQQDMFMQEQQNLARDIRTSITAGALTETQATALRLQWLNAQKQVLDQFYPRDDERVREAKARWEIQFNEVRGLGKFHFEP